MFTEEAAMALYVDDSNGEWEFRVEVASQVL